VLERTLQTNEKKEELSVLERIGWWERFEADAVYALERF
jgi:hypothetical protein